jgi:hypothetical protein
MKWNKLSFYLTSASLGLIVLFGYQNCSQTHFTSDLDGAVLKAETVSDGDRAAGDDGQLVGDGVQPTPASTATPDKKNPKGGSDTSGLVECQMLHPNQKVVLSYELFVQHGNSTSVRVCMSENACLKLINAFAVQHSCSLDASAPAAQADANRQCTEIFPGSKGTCHNAAIVTDAQVTELLKKMGEVQ